MHRHRLRNHVPLLLPLPPLAGRHHACRCLREPMTPAMTQSRHNRGRHGGAQLQQRRRQVGVCGLGHATSDTRCLSSCKQRLVVAAGAAEVQWCHSRHLLLLASEALMDPHHPRLPLRRLQLPQRAVSLQHQHQHAQPRQRRRWLPHLCNRGLPAPLPCYHHDALQLRQLVALSEAAVCCPRHGAAAAPLWAPERRRRASHSRCRLPFGQEKAVPQGRGQACKACAPSLQVCSNHRLLRQL